MQEVSGVYTSPFHDIVGLKMPLRGRNVSGSFEKRSPGPKLQADMFSILVRSPKELITLVGDVSQMYHQLALTLEDRPLHRFLWRNMDQSKEPEV